MRVGADDACGGGEGVLCRDCVSLCSPPCVQVASTLLPLLVCVSAACLGLSGVCPCPRLCACLLLFPSAVSQREGAIQVSTRAWSLPLSLCVCCECLRVRVWGSLLSEPSPVRVHLHLCLWAWLTCVGVRQGCPLESVGNTVLLDRRAWRSCLLRAPEPISFLPSEPPLGLGGQNGCGSQVWGQERGSETLPHADRAVFVQGGCVGCSGYGSGHFIACL